MSHWVASRVLWRPLHHSSFSLHPSLLVALALAFSILRNVLQRKVIYGEGPVCVRRGSGETPMTLRGPQRRFGVGDGGFRDVSTRRALRCAPAALESCGGPPG